VRVTMAELREEPDEESEEDDFLSSLRMPGAYHGSSPAQQFSPVLAPSRSTSPPSVRIETPPAALEPISLPPPTRVLTPVPTPAPAVVEEFEPVVPKRSKRPRTAYRFAHPPPPTRPLGKKGILRPKVLLQLQQKSDSGFHKPVYEVVPASRFAPRTRIGQKLQRLHKGRDGLAADDLVVVKTEDYKTSDTASEDVEFSDARDVLGMISAIPTDSDSAWISLENSTWKATAGLNGSYTLTLQGEHSQTARWYIPKAKRKRNSIVGMPSSSDHQEDRKYYFTNILPNTTKHPTVASMTPTNLEVYDEYVSTTAPDETVVTDVLLRKLIIVSGAWLFFREGWSMNYKFNTVPKPCNFRSVSMPIETVRRRSTLSCSPARSPTRPAAAEEESTSDAKAGYRESLSPPNRSVSPSALSTSVMSQSDARSIQGSTTTKAESVDISERLPYASQVTALRRRAATDLTDKTQKRRSWSHNEFTNFNWQSAKGSLSRRLTTTKKEEKTQSLALPSTGDSLPGSADSNERVSMRHIRRLSQSIRRPTSARTNIQSVDFTDIMLRTSAEPATVSRADDPVETETEKPAEFEKLEEVAAIQTVMADIATANEHDDALEPHSDTVLSNGPDDSHTSHVNDPLENPKKVDSPIMSTAGRAFAAESTDTLASTVGVVNYSYWQQFDHLLERQSTIHTLSIQPTPRRLVLSNIASESEYSEAKVPAVQHVDTSVPDTPSPRKPTWKEKLKLKLHV
jgi:hypothetical protein